MLACVENHLWVSEPLRQAHHKHQVPLDDTHTGQVFAVLCDLLLALVLLLFLLVLYPLQLFLRQGFVYSWVFWIGLEHREHGYTHLTPGIQSECGLVKLE